MENPLRHKDFHIDSFRDRSVPRFDAGEDKRHNDRVYRDNVEKVWKNDPPLELRLQKTDSIKAAMAFDIPNVQYILDTSLAVGSLPTVEGNLVHKDQEHNALKGQEFWKVVSPMDYVLFKSAPRSGARVLWLRTLS